MELVTTNQAEDVADTAHTFSLSLSVRGPPRTLLVLIIRTESQRLVPSLQSIDAQPAMETHPPMFCVLSLLLRLRLSWQRAVLPRLSFGASSEDFAIGSVGCSSRAQVCGGTYYGRRSRADRQADLVQRR
jgi:hypothetical protein